MERHLGEERLIAPNDFTSTAVSSKLLFLVVCLVDVYS